jgi:hypothetical protein
VSTIFSVTCPSCGEGFPVHTELWRAGYDLLCPFCGTSFPQDESPLIVGAHGERTVNRPDTGAAESM